MRVLFISGELIAGDLACKLQKEGCDVKLFIQNKELKHCLDGMVNKTNEWKKEISWVGKDGLIIFDDVGFGKAQDNLRKKGYQVVGGSGDGDRLELDRVYGQGVLNSYGVATKDFKTRTFSVGSAIEFIKKNRGEWVIKPNNHNTSLSYIGNLKDGSDVLKVLENYKNNFGGEHTVSLQKRVRGIEVAIGRFFNGKDWVGPSVINFEHKHLNNDDIGPLGGETGTLMWYENDEKNKLFQRTLAKIKPHLKKSQYKGYIDLNCIVNKNNVYPLELTSRFGSSTIETQSEIHLSPWSQFFLSIAKGNNYNLKFKNGYAVNVALAVPPFPYRTNDVSLYCNGLNIFFNEKMKKEDFNHIHFEGAMVKKLKGESNFLTAGNLGYVLYITGIGKTVHIARKKVYSILKKIMIPKMLYRTDIGLRFVRKDKNLLNKWGWIN